MFLATPATCPCTCSDVLSDVDRDVLSDDVDRDVPDVTDVDGGVSDVNRSTHENTSGTTIGATIPSPSWPSTALKAGNFFPWELPLPLAPFLVPLLPVKACIVK